MASEEWVRRGYGWCGEGVRRGTEVERARVVAVVVRRVRAMAAVRRAMRDDDMMAVLRWLGMSRRRGGSGRGTG
jgi:S-adenosylhomocysteine hydrolase